MEEVKSNPQEQQGDLGKQQRLYEANIKKLTMVLSGEANVKALVGKRIPSGDISNLIDELLKEKKEALAKGIKTDLMEILDKKTALDKAFSEEEKKLVKFKEEQMKKFNEEVSKVFNKIDGIQELEKSYYETLNTASGGDKEIKS